MTEYVTWQTVGIRCDLHESIDPSCLMSKVWAGEGTMVWGIPLISMEYHLNTAAYLRIVAGHVHPFMAYHFQMIIFNGIIRYVTKHASYQADSTNMRLILFYS